LRIAIDARKLRDYGIGTYVRNLLRHLSRLDQQTEYVVLCQQPDCSLVDELGENFRAVPESSPGYSIREQVTVPRDLRREHATLFHSPHYVLPPLTPCKTVVTIHDCIHLRFPQYLPNRLGYAYARTFLWLATHHSNRVITVSEASKRDILEYFNVPPGKIDVIYNGIDERFGEPPPEEDVNRVRERYQLDDPFILYAGNIKPHKNLGRLIEAFHIFRHRGTEFEQVKLVIIGDEISKYAALRHAVHRHKLHKHVRFFGFVPAKTLAILYRLAAVFVFPSLYEGFGLPPIEAMAAGAPVVTTTAGSLPEVCRDGADLVPPGDTDALAAALDRVLTDAGHRAALVARGAAVAAGHDWDGSADRFAALLARAATSVT
jgi:glycosyltransferase involved in cell wall biosynthesis